MSVIRFDHRSRLVDMLALGVLGVMAWAVAGNLVRDDVFIYGDHAGHFYTLWYTLNVAVPEHHRIIDWMPYWYAGYPELLFYPPGSVILGVVLNALTLGKLSTVMIYESIVFIAYALPAFTFYYALRRLKFGCLAAFAAGLLVLGFPAFFDGAPAVIIGMIGSRLSFGLIPLVLVWAIDFIETQRWRFGGWTTLAFALAVLLHPYHVIGLTLSLGLYILIRRLPLVPASARLGGVILLALSLDAFWLIPLATHSSSAMIPLIRSTLDQTWRLLTDAMLLPYAVLALVAVTRVRHDLNSVRRSMLIVLIVLPILLGALMLAVHVVLIEWLRFYQLDPVRLIGEYYLAIILLAAIGLANLTGWLSDRFTPARLSSISTAAMTALVGFILLMPFVQTSVHLPKANAEPRFLKQAIEDYRLDELWEILRETPGRILFTSHFTRLNAHGTESFPTTVTAVAPIFTNRQIMGGTFGRWSPVAALMWTGHIDPPVLWGLPEEQDDRALFGVPLETLSDAQMYEYCRRFNITTIVASINDFRTRTFLDASQYFHSYYNSGFFFVYRVNEYDNAWIQARNATVSVRSFGDDEIVLHVDTAQANASVNVKVFAFALWRAVTDAGQALPIKRDDLALMQIALPPGEDYTVTLRYVEGAAEQAGVLISILSGGLLLGGGMIGLFLKKTP